MTPLVCTPSVSTLRQYVGNAHTEGSLPKNLRLNKIQRSLVLGSARLSTVSRTVLRTVCQTRTRTHTIYFQGAPKGRQQKGETGPGTHIFADFRRFLLIVGSLCKSRDLGVADLRRKPQETADFRRKPQIFAETGLSHLLSPFWRAPILEKKLVLMRKCMTPLVLSGPISRDIAILSRRYPISRDSFSGRLALPQNGAITPPWYLVSHRHICAIPRFATYRAIIVRYPRKQARKGFCDTIATSIARYEKYRCWASKPWCAPYESRQGFPHCVLLPGK